MKRTSGPRFFSGAFATGRLRMGLACAGALLASACATPPRTVRLGGPGEEWPALHVRQDAPAQSAASSEEKEELAKKLNNPVADLISVPIQGNYDHEIGVNDDGQQWLMWDPLESTCRHASLSIL